MSNNLKQRLTNLDWFHSGVSWICNKTAHSKCRLCTEIHTKKRRKTFQFVTFGRCGAHD